MRTETGSLYEATSKDDGLTWEDFKSSGIRSVTCCAQLYRLADGRIALLWNHPSRRRPADIRSREEWQETGLAEPALPISMHEGGFVQKLLQAMGGDPSRRVALICATGGRTRYVQNVLASNGFSNVIDVSEGMMGSPAGPGWLKRGLPVKRWKPQ